MTGQDPLHVAARSVLLDALVAVAAYRRSLIVVGAQAVYLRTTEARLSVAAFTTDGDIVIDPALLPSTPPLEATLADAGFVRSVHPGSWVRTIAIDGRQIDVQVDFMVPEAVALGGGRRSVVLEGHDRHAARRVRGLEAALIDHGPMRIAAIDPADPRSVTAEVAGPAALLIAKIHKVSERVQTGRHRRNSVDKDAGDIFRLVQATSIADMAAGFRSALDADVARDVARSARDELVALFGSRSAAGVLMAIRAIGVVGEDPETITAILTAYVDALRSEL
jgi:hypothetical protein